MQPRRFFASPWFYPVLGFAVLLATAAFYLPRLGFYWDDWPVVYLSRFRDPRIAWDLFYYIRPLSAWTYTLTLPVLGMHPLAWQMFALLLRWLGVLGLCAALAGVWPQKTWQIRWMGLLLALYPGFLQQAVSVAYIQHFFTFALFGASLAGMVWAQRRPERFLAFTIPSLLAALLHLLTMEYFFGLELLRPMLLWFLLRRPGEPTRRGLWRALRAWLPYAAVLLVFVLFRFVFYDRLIAAPDANPAVLLIRARTDLPGALSALVEHAVQDSAHLLVFAWTQSFTPDLLLLKTRLVWLTLAAGLLIAGLAGWALLRARPGGEAAVGNAANWQIPLLGGLALLLGGLPVWATDRQVIVGTWSDRFALAPMVGAVILVVWLVDWLSSHRARQTAALAVLLALSISAQMRTYSRYAAYWDIMRQYYWQLSWRAPALEPGTAVIGPEMPFALVGDYSIGFALNALYGGALESTRADTWFIEGERYLGSNTIKSYAPGTPIFYQQWNVTFEGSTDRVLPVTFNNARGCLRVIDPIYAGVLPMAPGDATLLPLATAPPAVLREPVHPVPQDIFGREPAHTWCYYYQKAELARQFKDWPRVTALADEAAAAGYAPQNGAELFPFIQAYALQNRWDAALEATRQSAALAEKMSVPLCNLWAGIRRDTPASPQQQSALETVRHEQKCSRW